MPWAHLQRSWRGWAKIAAVGALLALLVLQSPAARGAERFEVPADCGSPAQFAAELRRLLGPAAAHAMPDHVWIGERDERGEHLMRLQMGRESRTLRDPDCRTLLESAVLIAAAAAREREPARARPRAFRNRRSLASAGRRAEPSTAPGEHRARHAPWGVSLGAGVGSGVTPAPAPTLELGVVREPEPWGLAVAFRWWPSQSAARAGRGVDVVAFGASASAALILAPSLRVNLGAEINRLTGQGQTSVSGRTTDRAWQISPLLALSIIPHHSDDFYIEASAVGRLPLLRPSFVVNGFGEVYGAPLVGADAIIRVAWLFR